MLPSLGFNEIIILGILALVVVGPKDLPLLVPQARASGLRSCAAWRRNFAPASMNSRAKPSWTN